MALYCIKNAGVYFEFPAKCFEAMAPAMIGRNTFWDDTLLLKPLGNTTGDHLSRIG